jgi:hypothetical protein
MTVDGAVASNEMPGRIIFKTTPLGSNVPAEVLRLSSDKSARFAGDVAIDDRLKAGGFYLDPGAQGIGRSLNDTMIPFDVGTADVDNYWLESFVDQGFIIKDVELITQTGSCTVSFYIHGDGETHPGVSVTGLDPIAASTTKATAIATAENVVNRGDSLVLSVPANTSATHLRGRLKISLSG